MKIYTPIFFAYENAKPTLYISLINLAVNTILSIVLFIYIGFIGIPIATSLSAWMSIVLMNYYLEKNNYFKVKNKIIFPLIIIITASLLIYLYLFLLKNYVAVFLNFSQYHEIISFIFSTFFNISLFCYNFNLQTI